MYEPLADGDFAECRIQMIRMGGGIYVVSLWIDGEAYVSAVSGKMVPRGEAEKVVRSVYGLPDEFKLTRVESLGHVNEVEATMSLQACADEIGTLQRILEESDW